MNGWQVHEPGIVKAPDWMPNEQDMVAIADAPHVLVAVANLQPLPEWPREAGPNQ